MSEFRRGGHGGHRGRGGDRGGGRGGGQRSDSGHGGGRGFDTGRGGGRGFDGGRGGGRGFDGGRGGGRGFDGGRGRGAGRGRGRGRDDEDVGPWPDRGCPPPTHVIAEKDKPDNPFKLLKEVGGIQIERSLAYTLKPKPGSSGRKISLLTNYFMLNCTFKQPVTVHHYDVTIERQVTATSGDEAAASEMIPGSRKRALKLEKRFNRLIIDKMVNDYGRDGNVFQGIIPVYDYGKNLYTKKPLNMKSKFAVTDEDGPRLRMEVTAKEFKDDEPLNYIVVIKHAADIIIDPAWTIFPQEAIQFIDICLRYGPTRDNIPVGCKIFFPDAKRRRDHLRMNKELSFGFYQSARNCEAGLMLNVDRAAAVFHRGGSMMSVFDEHYKGINQKPRIPDFVIVAMSKELRGMRVKVTHLRYPRKERVFEFSPKPASELKFTLENKDENGKVTSKEQITVADYFKRHHKKELRYPHLPCLVAGSKKSPKYFPLEVCELLPDQYVARKLHAEVLSQMTELAASQKPNARFNEITDSVKDCIRKDGVVFNKEFGLNVGVELVQLQGRVQETPILQYDGLRFRPTNDCSWSMSRPEEKRFYRSVPINRWVLVDMSPRGYARDFLEEFSRKMIQIARSLGVQMQNPLQSARHSFTNTHNLKINVFERVREMKNVQLIVFLIPDKKEECYYAIKKLGDIDYGIPTQCCSDRHYKPDPNRNKLLNFTYVTNVLLKINAKLNGLNTILDVGWAKSKKIMFVGVDVTHPRPGANNELSIASCVGSYDNSFVQYIAKLTAQDQVRREIVNLDKMMKELLETYKKQNNCWPETIIVYRDGVSEGQFDHVLAFEFTKLVRLFDEMKMTSKPKVTYIIVQKRHHTRFLNVRKEDSNKLNVPPGTTVDTGITDPVKFDFFICSHQGLLGTSRPSRYWVLFDQNNFSADMIQQITYYMCFVYPRCTKSVSIPVPVAFAHLSAYRARHHVAEVLGSDYSSSISVSSLDSKEAKQEKEKQLQEYTEKMNKVIRVNPNLSTRLYYL